MNSSLAKVGLRRSPAPKWHPHDAAGEEVDLDSPERQTGVGPLTSERAPPQLLLHLSKAAFLFTQRGHDKGQIKQ